VKPGARTSTIGRTDRGRHPYQRHQDRHPGRSARCHRGAAAGEGRRRQAQS
jgi:hypothetical protein